MLWWTLRQLGSDDWKKRDRAKKMLAQSRDPRAVKPLIKMLNHKNDIVRLEVAYLLRDIGDPSTVEPLAMALGDGYDAVRLGAARALQAFGDARAVEALIAALDDRDSDVCRVAAMALGRIGDSRAVEPLVAKFNSTMEGTAAGALEKLGWQPAVDYKRAQQLIERGDWKEVVGMGEAALKPLLTELYSQSSSVREQAASALAELGDARAIEPLVMLLKGENLVIEKALARIDPEWRKSDPVRNMMPRLKKALDDSDPHARTRTIETLGAIGSPEAVELLITALRDVKDTVRDAAAFALGRVGDARAVRPLISIITYESRRAHVGEYISGPAEVVSALRGLRSALELDAANVAGEELKTLQDLLDSSDVDYSLFSVYNHCADDLVASTLTRNEELYRQVKQLTRQELARRETLTAAPGEEKQLESAPESQATPPQPAGREQTYAESPQNVNELPAAPPPRSSKELFDMASLAAERGQLDDAISAFEIIPVGAPEYQAAVLNRAILLARMGFSRDATRLLEALSGGDDPVIALALAECRKACELNQSPACLSIPLRQA